jgi:hypothetical protein
MAFSTATAVSGFRAPLAARPRSVVAHGISKTVKETLKPRVNELRRNQLSAGTTSVNSALLLLPCHAWAVPALVAQRTCSIIRKYGVC